MVDVDLRPLSLGEILDRSFSLYRRHFWLFLGVTVLPVFVSLIVSTIEVEGRLLARPRDAALRLLVSLVIGQGVRVFAQGGATYAVAEVYFGRSTSIRASLSQMWRQSAKLFAIFILSGFAELCGLISLVVPGVYIGCRLRACVPAALLENIGASKSLFRAWDLTSGYVWRSFVIYLFGIVLYFMAGGILGFPFSFAAARHLGPVSTLRELGLIGFSLANVLTVPYIAVATAVFYFDLRVRKEAFDLQLMLNPGVLAGTAHAPTVTTTSS